MALLYSSPFISRIGTEHYITETTNGHHRVIADEPVEKGGHDTGYDPHGYLLTALGSCTSITLRMYADRKSLPLHSVEVQLNIEKAIVKTDRDIILRNITVCGSFTSAQVNRLLEIANNCPVHKVLRDHYDIQSQIKIG